MKHLVIIMQNKRELTYPAFLLLIVPHIQQSSPWELSATDGKRYPMITYTTPTPQPSQSSTRPTSWTMSASNMPSSTYPRVPLKFFSGPYGPNVHETRIQGIWRRRGGGCPSRDETDPQLHSSHPC